jgi:hypothetical protein
MDNSIGKSTGKSSYMAVLFVPKKGTCFPGGETAVDEIILEAPVSSYRLNAGAFFEWSLPGRLLGIGNRAIVSDLSLQAAFESAAYGNPFADGNGSSMNGRTGAEVSLFGFRVGGNYSHSLNAVNTNGVAYN